MGSKANEVRHERAGKYLRRMRKKAGLTQVQLVQQLKMYHKDISVQGISAYERGIAFPKPPLLRALTKILGINEDELLKRY